MLSSQSMFQRMFSHPFWTEVMAVKRGGNPLIRQVVEMSPERRVKFLSLIVKGFYPLGCVAHIPFRQVAVNSSDATAKEIGQFICDVELGFHPLLKNAAHVGIPHNDCFRLGIESLEPGAILPAPRDLGDRFVAEMGIENADLSCALAGCEVIENLAPFFNFRIQDFMAQWQTMSGLPSEKVNKVYVNEHGLTEGDQSEQQHISLLGKMTAPHLDVVRSPEYEANKRKFFEHFMRPLTAAYDEITETLAQWKEEDSASTSTATHFGFMPKGAHFFAGSQKNRGIKRPLRPKYSA
jgi:hypothetical protein